MMNRLLPLATTALLALPGGLCAMAQDVPLYTVSLVNTNPNGNQPSVSYFDVENVQGLNVKSLLQTTYPPLNKLGRFSFVREWDADPELSFEVGQKRDGPNAYTGVEVSLKRTPNFLELGNPYFTEWGLVAENGAFVQEISVFTYTCRAVSATSAISTGGGQHE